MKRALAIASIALIMGAAVVYNLRARSAPPPPAPGQAATGTPSQAEPLAVTTATARRGNLLRSLTVVGVLRADHEAAITAKVPSRIAAVLVRNGESVRSGQPLVRLDMGDIAAQLDAARAGIAAAEAQYRKAVLGKGARRVEMDSKIAEAQSGLRTALAKQRQAVLAVTLTGDTAKSDSERAAAAVKQAEAGLKQAEIGLKQADETVERLRFLYAHGGVARADLDGAETQASIARAQRDEALAGLEQAKAAAAPAAGSVDLRRQVSEADVAAARAGVDMARRGLASAYRARADALRIADRDIDAARAQLTQAKAGSAQAAAQVGDSVLASPLDGAVADLSIHPGELAQPGMRLMTVVAHRPVHMEANVPARSAGSIRPGLDARISVETLPGASLDGEVTEVLPVASSDNRTVPARIRIAHGGAGLTPGMMARAVIDLPPSASTVSVPADAIHSQGDSSFVYVIADGRIHRRIVRVGAVEGQLALLDSGVRAGERVVVAAPAPLEPGMPVREAGR